MSAHTQGPHRCNEVTIFGAAPCPLHAAAPALLAALEGLVEYLEGPCRVRSELMILLDKARAAICATKGETK